MDTRHQENTPLTSREHSELSSSAQFQSFRACPASETVKPPPLKLLPYQNHLRLARSLLLSRGLYGGFVARRGARLSVVQSAEGYKPRGRGLGRRNGKVVISHLPLL